ncbi:putative drug exporter of the RND superfamily [Streptomyces sp. WMMB 714]|uniref:MMPL family transporter n=1 Tax=Streptomyces sp. WMMB 714 TaxID=1286822 RepID=UPI000823E4B1|nr:MMPL family transporter [Streptomyces sp. WMMB 714]SCK35820.1 putative drug exporter of the RND superfamily [Streptomyces sp. WMMB 714]
MTALARWCLRRRLAVVLMWCAVLVGVGASALVAGSGYSNKYDVPGTETARASTLLSEAFPDRSGDSDTIVWHTDSGRGADKATDSVRDTEVRDRMDRALDDIADQPGVRNVTSPYGEGVEPPPEPGEQGHEERISRDGHTAYATVTFDSAVEDVEEKDVQAVIDTAKKAGGDVEGLQVELGGPGIALTEEQDGHLSEAVGIAVAAVVLLLAFGSFAAMLLPLVTALVSVGTSILGIGLLSHVMTIADFAPMLGTLIGLGVGIDYALFIVTRHRRGLKEGLPVEEAAQRALASAGRAVVFAGVTVCIALLGMLVLRLDFLNGVAVAASLTVVLAVLASVTLVPALLGVIGMRALSRRERRRLEADGPEAPAGTGDPGATAEKPALGGAAAKEAPGECEPAANTPRTAPAGAAARWSSFVARRPRLLGGFAAAVMVLLALPVFGLQLGTSDQGNNPTTSTSRQAYDLLADGFGPGTNGPLTLVAEIDGAAAKLDFEKLPAELRDVEGVAHVSGGELDGSGSTGVITVVPDSAPQAQETSELVEHLRTDVLPEASDSSSLEVRVGGVTAAHDDFADVILGKLPLFVGIVVSLGCVLLLLAFRSIGIPLKAALMNVLAVAAACGVVVAVFQWGWGSSLLGLGGPGPIEPFLPVIMVSVLFGLSMDYQVFLVSRMYEEWRRTGDNRRAVRVGLAETGRVINSAAVIMIAVFGAFVLSGDRIIAMFGIGLAAAVALDAFVLRTLLVPALMHMLGGANWWLPAWLERRLPRLSIEPEQVPGPVPGTPVPGQVPAAEPVPEPVPGAVPEPAGGPAPPALPGQRREALIGLSESTPTVTPHGYRDIED